MLINLVLVVYRPRPIFYDEGCHGIVNVAVSRRQQCLYIVVDMWWFQMIFPGEKSLLQTPKWNCGVEGSGNYNYRRPVRARYPVRSARLFRSR